MTRTSIRFIFRGAPVEIADFAPRETLLDWLRLRARATGTKEGCAEGDCGACTIVLARARDGVLLHRPVNSCILLLGQIDGAELLTIEDLAVGDALHPVQAAMVEKHGSQCGFCTPGIVMSLFALYHEGARPATRGAVCDQLAGNLCRCTGYRPIVEAALDACAAPPADRFAAATPARLAAIAALADADDILVGDEARGFFAAPACEDSLAALCLRHPDARLIAGATDVGLTITKALRSPEKIIWLGRLSGFDSIASSPTGLSLGAGALLAEAAGPLAAIHEDLGEILRRFGSAQVRASGTLGGNIANASPIGDLAPCLIALGASIELRRGEDVRRMALEEFFIAYGRQNRQPGEFLRRVMVPALAADSAFRAYKISKRFDEDISALLGAFHFTLHGRKIVGARIAFGGMAGTPARAPLCEAACLGIDLDEPDCAEAAVAALSLDFAPIDDMRASADYRRRVAGNLLRKALREIGAPRGASRANLRDLSHVAA